MNRLIHVAIFASFAVFAFGAFASLRFDHDELHEPDGQPEPTLRLLRFEPDDRFLMAVTRFSNRTMQPIYFYGHSPEVPMQSLESRGESGWQDCGCIWCGSGAGTHELKPGQSIELRTPVARLDRDEDYQSFGYRTVDTSRSLRVRTHFGFAGERAVKPVWSGEFRYPRREHENALSAVERREP